MRPYSDRISLNENARGVYSLDTIMGCESGMKKNKNGCYGDCYAARKARVYGFDFSKSILRNFDSQKHIEETKRKIKRLRSPFIRIGTFGDPSENWEHTVKILRLIQPTQLSLFHENKTNIVIITKHWNNISDNLLKYISRFNITFNTSVSALDNEEIINNAIYQYNRLKKYCRSVLRIVTCKFNEIGCKENTVQNKLLKHPHIDTVLRCSKNNEYVKSGLLNIEPIVFLGHKCYASINNKKTHLGHCNNCPDLCGINHE